MDMPHDKNEEPIEIRLDTHAGLRDFTGYVHSQHEMYKKEVDSLSSQESLANTIKSGSAAYTELTKYLVQVEALLDDDEMPTQSLVTLIQDSYDEFIRTYEILTEHIQEDTSKEDTSSTTKKSHSLPAEGDALRTSRPQVGRENKEKLTVVTPRFLQTGDNKYVIEKHFGSISAFESAIWRIVREIERPQKLDSFLGVEHGSVFKEILKDQVVSDLLFFNQQSGEKIREALQMMELDDGVVYDYRIFTEWMKEFREMQRLVPQHEEITFAELIAYTMLTPYRDD